MKTNVKSFLIGMVLLPIVLIVGTLGASVFLGWIGWESPMEFFNNSWQDWTEDGLPQFIRTIATTSVVIGILNIYIQKYLKDD